MKIITLMIFMMIFREMIFTKWIRNKAGLGPDGQFACNIVVSFFIQNCEVFHK